MIECTVYTSVRCQSVTKKEIEKIASTVMHSQKKQGMVSVHLVGDGKIKKMNNQYRGKNCVTDVLSFGTEDKQSKRITNVEKDWGDIFLCIPQIKRQAKDCEVKEKEEITRMLVHGLLHLFGYEHTKPEMAERMFQLQERQVKRLI